MSRRQVSGGTLSARPGVSIPTSPRAQYRLAQESHDPAVLHELAQVPASWVRKSVAWRDCAAPATLIGLLDDPDPDTRYAATRNRNTPIDAIPENRVTDKDHRIRLALAYRGDCPPAWLRQLCLDTDPEIRRVAVGNAATPLDAVAGRAADPDWEVRQKVGYSIARMDPDGIAAVLAVAPDLAKRVARNRDAALSDATFAMLAGNPDKWIRCDVAERPDCPVWVLGLLAKDADLDVRKRVAKHPNATVEILTELALGKSVAVCAVIAERDDGAGGAWMLAHAEARIRLNWVRAMTPARTAEANALLAPLRHDPSVEVRMAVAAALSDPALLAEMAGDEAWKVRLAVARSRHIRPQTISALMGDPAVKVREVASERFLTALSRAVRA